MYPDVMTNYTMLASVPRTGDWRRISPPKWAQLNVPRCMYCHPSPVAPFPDCPHGHYLNPWRLEQQLRYELRSDGVWYTLVYLATVFVFPVAPILGAITTFFYLLFLLFFLVGRALDRSRIKELYRMGCSFDDPFTPLWEKRTRRNEPWNRRIYP